MEVVHRIVVELYPFRICLVCNSLFLRNLNDEQQNAPHFITTELLFHISDNHFRFRLNYRRTYCFCGFWRRNPDQVMAHFIANHVFDSDDL